MQQNDKYQLILGSKVFFIPNFFPNLLNASSSITSILIHQKKYVIKSIVNENTLEAFIKNWINNEQLNINDENYQEYQSLSQEFDRIKGIIKVYSKQKAKTTSQTMKKSYNEKLLASKFKQFQKKKSNFEQIIDILFKKKGIDKYTEYYKIKEQLYDACKSENIELVTILKSKKFYDYNKGLSYILNEENMTANIYENLKKNNIEIPRSIRYKSKEYLVTGVIGDSFYGCADDYLIQCYEMKSFKFSKNSAFRSIPYGLISCSYLHSLTIPEGVVELEEGWCMGTYYLSNIKILPNNVHFTFYEGTFLLGKTNLESDVYDILYFARRDVEIAIIPSFIKVIKPFAFDSCKNLQRIEFANHSELRTIANNAFKNSSIESISIPSSIEELEEEWCANINNLIKVEVKVNGKENIMYYDNKFLLGKSDQKSDIFDILIFARRNIENAVIPSFIKRISSYAFHYCIKLNRVFFEENSNLISIGKSAFYSSNIERITIPSSIWLIEDYAFQFCINLQKVDFSEQPKSNLIHSNVVEIGMNAFCYCEELKEIDFSNLSKMISIEKNTFPKSIEKINMPLDIIWPSYWPNFNIATYLDDISFIEKQTQSIKQYNDALILGKTNEKVNLYDKIVYVKYDCIDLVIPCFIKEIGESAFIYTKIKEILVPSSVSKIHDFAFKNCSELTKIEFKKDSKLEFICKGAFYASGITSIIVPDQVKIIGEEAFGHCKKLKKVEFSENSKLALIGKAAFNNSRLKAIIIPKHVERIVAEAFCECFQLKKVEFSKNSELKIIENNAFQNTSIKSISIPDKVNGIGDFCFSNCYKLTTIYFSGRSELKSIGKQAFYASHYPSSLTTLSIPSCIEEFDVGWCDLLKQLNNITIHQRDNQNIIYYNDSFIIGKSELNSSNYNVLIFARRDIEEATIPSFIKHIAPFAFASCVKLNKVVFEDQSNIQSIGIYAFSSSSIASFVIPDKVKSIQIRTFFYCENLKTVEFSNETECESIEDEAFKGSPIENISLPSSIRIQTNRCTGIEIAKNIKIIENPIKNLCNYEDKAILGKSDDKASVFDILLYARMNTEKFTFPHFISKVAPYAFSLFSKPQYVIIPDDSKLLSISKCSFSNSLITFIRIPSNVTAIGESAFACCEMLKTIEFPSNSRLRVIKKNAFYESSLESIEIPDHVIRIESGAFERCVNLRKVALSSHSELQYIGKCAFEETSIESFYVPSHVKQISSDAFNSCCKLQIIEIDENSELLAFNIQKMFDTATTKKILIMKKTSIQVINENMRL